MANQHVYQNFVIFDPSNTSHDPLQVVFKPFPYLPSSFPVPLQFTTLMYNPEGNTPLGTIPNSCVPYFVPLAPSALKYQPSILPRIPQDYKLIVYFWCPQGSGNTYLPRYIVVPDHFSPTMAKPSKIPIAIRTRLTLSNGIRPVIHLDMPVIYTPPQKALPPGPKNSKRNLPPRNSGVPNANKHSLEPKKPI